MEESGTRVCVTGGSGYIGSLLVKRLLEKGYIVNATLRNLEDKSKVGLLKSLPNADFNLALFQADIYNPSEFQTAIEGCEFVLHVATPMQHDTTNSKYKDRIEATVAGAKSIADFCLRSPTVKRLIYTASVMAASPLNEDGNGFKSAVVDESSWTPISLSFTNCSDYTLDYTKAKTLAEKEVLSYNGMDDSKLEVVSLACGLVGGETLLSHQPPSIEVMLSQLAGNSLAYKYALRFIEELLGSIPLVHVEDVCEVHILCAEKPSMRGRFLCAAASPTSREMATYFQENYPEFSISQEFVEEPFGKVLFDSSKLMKLGFEYKYDMKMIMDESFKCSKRLGAL